MMAHGVIDAAQFGTESGFLCRRQTITQGGKHRHRRFEGMGQIARSRAPTLNQYLIPFKHLIHGLGEPRKFFGQITGQ